MLDRRWCRKVEVGLSQIISHRTRVKVFKLHWGRVRLAIRTNFFSEGVLMHWNRLPSKVAESSSFYRSFPT